MSFRGRLFIFFTIIVIVPMAAVAVVLFKITSDSETGKSDSRIAQGLTTALAVYQADVDRAQSALTQVARDPRMSRALATQKQAPIRRRARQILEARPDIAAIAVYDRNEKRVVYVRRSPALAYATAAPTTSKGKRVGTLAVSRTTGEDFVRSVRRLTGLDLEVLSGGTRLAQSGNPDGRSRFQQIRTAPLTPVSVGVFDPVDDSSVNSSRALIGAILLAFLLLALASSVLVVRALQGQIGDFLAAAQRLGRGDFSNPVPVHGRDEFADLGREFNKMSAELEGHIAEVESKRAEVEEAIRRIGEAVGAGLDREGVVALVVRTTVEACGAEAGRALPIDPGRMEYFECGFGVDGAEPLRAGLMAAEREAFQIDRDIG